MATKYILDPSGNIIDAEFSLLNPDNTISPLVREPTDVSVDVQQGTYGSVEAIHQNVDVSVGDDFGMGNPKAKVTNVLTNDPAFGFIEEQTGSRDSFKPMYHFSDPNNRYFAKEFEMLTGYTGIIVGDTDEVPQLDIMFYIFEYFIEMIVMLGVVEGFTVLNELLSHFTTNHTNTNERFDLRLGKYSIVEYDIFTKYIFTVLNYPKDHSNFLTRITSLFVGFAAWLTPDEPFFVERIIEEATRIKGSQKLENFYELMGVKNQNVLFGLGTSLANIGLAAVEILVNTLLSDASYKRLNLLTKKFRQEKVWKNSLYRHKPGNEAKFFVELDYYYFRFAIERIHVGLKLLNRYAHEKTYLNPKHREGPLTRVSSHRTTRKAGSVGGIDQEIKAINDLLKQGSAIDSAIKAADKKHLQMERYFWKAEDSDSQGYKPGMTTRLRALPQLLNLGNSFLKSIILNKPEGDNKPFNLDKSILQNFYKHSENSRRIPKELVEEIENYLESEYVPFYMHDLRTNEILSFHAFIESISDAFTPDYTSASGFGRIEDVRSYVKTTRNINMSFTLAATSETDHDFMWYQINKLVTMVYPQWSEGFATKDKQGRTHFYPFTQVPTASPLVRIRLGDVIKNNYSRSSLSRIFGTELDPAIAEPSADTPQIKVKNTPGKFEQLMEKDNFVYELLPGLYKTEPDDTAGGAFFPGLETEMENRAYYEVKNPIKLQNLFGSLDLNKPYVKVMISADEGDYKNKAGNPISLNVDSSRVIQQQVKFKATPGTVGDFKEHQKFSQGVMKPFSDLPNGNSGSNNPITNAYESGMSRGIAGFITQLDLNYNESNWETSRIGSKAPMLVKVTLNFAPIHDIPPGIDHYGMMRAPIYNVGRVNNQFFGDSHDEEVIGSGIQKAITKYGTIKRKSENLE